MKRSEYKIFKNIVSKANRNSDVWWCGCDFLDLTNAQAQEIALIASKHFGVTYNTRMQRNEVLLPSGISIIIK